MSVHEFLTLVKRALFSTDASERNDGEQKLLQLRDASIDSFFVQCVQGLHMDTLEPALRQACGTLLKRCLGLYSTQHQCYYWLACQPESKQNIKNALLNLLIANQILVRKSAADCISGICAIELPRKEWPEIIKSLVQNTANTSTEIKQAAIMTLGYICQALKAINTKDCIDEQESEQILFGICQSMKKDETDVEIKLQAVKGLSDCLTFMDSQFGKKVVRDYVTTMLLENAVHENEQIRVAALQGMIDYAKILYAHIGEYIQPFLFTTAPSIQKADVSISVPAMEVWTVIGTESQALLQRLQAEAKRSNQQLLNQPVNPLLQVYQQLLPLLIENLLRNDEDEDDEDEAGLSIQESAYKASAAVAESVGTVSHSIFTSFITNTIHAAEWEKRKAAVLSFGALAEFAENDAVRMLVLSAIKEVTLMLNDPNTRVKKAVARVLARVAENYPETILLHQNCLQILEIILESTKQNPKVAIHIMWALSYLTENFDKFAQSAACAQYKVVLQVLAQSTTRQDLTNQDGQIINLAFVGIQNVMRSLNEPAVLASFLDDFHQQFITTANVEGWRREIIQQGLLTVMHGCLLRYNIIVRKLQSPSIPLAKIDTWYQSVVAYFRSTGDVNSDGIYLVSAIATYLQKQFTPYCQDFVTTFLNHAISKRQNSDSFKASIFSLADIARAIGSDFVQYQTTLEFFKQLIQDPTLDRELKLHIYSSMADVVYGVGREAESSVYQVMECLQIGFQAAIKLSVNPDPELQDYADRLKEILTPAFTNVLHAFNDTQQPFMPLYDSLQWLYHALELLTAANLKPTVEYIRSSLNLIVDFANFYRVARPQEINRLLISKLVQHLATVLQSYKHEPENKDTLQYLNYISQMSGAPPMM